MPSGFDVSFPTKVQASDDLLRFMRPAKEQFALPGVHGRFRWDPEPRSFQARYTLPKRLSGVIVGVCASVFEARDESESFTVVAVSTDLESYEPFNLTIGNVADFSIEGELPIIEPSLRISQNAASFILSDHLDEIVLNKILNLTGEGEIEANAL